jgi:hypothetical protein
MQTLDIISISALENFDSIIDANPYSTDIKLKRISKDGQFGYETIEKTSELITVGLIIYAPERRFLNNIGMHLDKNDSLPIVGLFKNADKFKREDVIQQITRDYVDGQEIDVLRSFRIVDVKTFGLMQTGKKIFLLAPIREKDNS